MKEQIKECMNRGANRCSDQDTGGGAKVGVRRAETEEAGR